MCPVPAVDPGVTIERGFNANGSFVRFFDESGVLFMQTCTKNITLRSNLDAITFPIAFPDLNDLSVQMSSGDANRSLAQNSTTVEGFTLRINLSSSGATASADVTTAATWVKGT